MLPTTQLVQAAQPSASSVANTQSSTQQPTRLVLQGLNLNAASQQQQQQQQLGSGIQIVQQIVGPNGEIQQIPVNSIYLFYFIRNIN